MDKMEVFVVASLSRLFVRFCAKRGWIGEARRRNFWRVYCDQDMSLRNGVSDRKKRLEEANTRQ